LLIPVSAFAQGHSERTSLCKKKTPLMVYEEEVSEWIIGSTPLEPISESKSGIRPETDVTFVVDKAGRISKWKLISLSGSVNRDFQTLYAVSSCPPLSSTNIESPTTLRITNIEGMPGVRGIEAEKWRSELQKSLAQKKQSSVSFPIIPASFIGKFPDLISIEDVCAKENIAEIPKNLLFESTATKQKEDLVFVDSANKSIESNTHIKTLLSSWSEFFERNQSPKRSDILKHAEDIRTQLKSMRAGFLPPSGKVNYTCSARQQ